VIVGHGAAGDVREVLMRENLACCFIVRTNDNVVLPAVKVVNDLIPVNTWDEEESMNYE
jgi:hypothetical protein